jgi:hypothetical protein
MQVLHTVPSSASSFNFQFPLVSLRSPRSCLRLHHRLPITSIFLFMFPSVTCCTGQFPSTFWPMELTFLLFHCLYVILLLLTLCITSSFFRRSIQMMSILLKHHISKFPGIFYLPSEMSKVQHDINFAPNVALSIHHLPKESCLRSSV